MKKQIPEVKVTKVTVPADEVQVIQKTVKPLKRKKTTAKTRFFLMWDMVDEDYAMTAFFDFPVFTEKKKCQEIVDLWNKQCKKPRYRTIEVLLAQKDAQKYKK